MQLLCWDFETVQPVIYRFQISYLTFDFPLQLGFNLHFSTLVSIVQLPRGFLLKAASDIKFQLSYSEITHTDLYFSLQGYSDATVFCNVLHLGLSIYTPLCSILQCNLLTTHHKIKYLPVPTILSFGVCAEFTYNEILEAVGSKNLIYIMCMHTWSSFLKKCLGRPVIKQMQNMFKAASWVCCLLFKLTFEQGRMTIRWYIPCSKRVVNFPQAKWSGWCLFINERRGKLASSVDPGDGGWHTLMEILGLLYTPNKQAGLWGTASSGKGETHRAPHGSLWLSPPVGKVAF